VQINPNKVYWYALKSLDTQQNKHVAFDMHPFESYHPMVRDIMKATPPQAIHTAFISDLKPIQKWHKEHVCLLGDAAHATTPNMGQGACQAIEDAYMLSECLQRFEPNEAFSIYQKNRISKAHHVVNKSWALGKLAHWKNPLATQLRNQLIRITPNSVGRKQSGKIFQLGAIQ
jgi:2-polyprenyl-6-methoxyphenol hydroxylase-like FAD-dependent oxidoreductase